MLGQLDVAAKLGADRLVVIIRLLQTGENDDRVLVFWVVAIFENQLERDFRILIPAFGDPLLGQLDACLRKTIQRVAILPVRVLRIGNEIHRELILRDRLVVVLVFVSQVALFDRVLPAAHVIGPAGQFTFGGGLPAKSTFCKTARRQDGQRSEQS